MSTCLSFAANIKAVHPSYRIIESQDHRIIINLNCGQMSIITSLNHLQCFEHLYQPHVHINIAQHLYDHKLQQTSKLYLHPTESQNHRIIINLNYGQMSIITSLNHLHFFEHLYQPHVHINIAQCLHASHLQQESKLYFHSIKS